MTAPTTGWLGRQIFRRSVIAAAADLWVYQAKVDLARIGFRARCLESDWPYLDSETQLQWMREALGLNAASVRLVDEAMQLEGAGSPAWRRVRDRLRSGSRFRNDRDARRSEALCRVWG